jgi:hypothetical protein
MSSGTGGGGCRLISSVDTAVFDWPLMSRLEFRPPPGAVPCVRLHAQIAGGKSCRDWAAGAGWLMTFTCWRTTR